MVEVVDGGSVEIWEREGGSGGVGLWELLCVVSLWSVDVMMSGCCVVVAVAVDVRGTVSPISGNPLSFPFSVIRPEVEGGRGGGAKLLLLLLNNTLFCCCCCCSPSPSNGGVCVCVCLHVGEEYNGCRPHLLTSRNSSRSIEVHDMLRGAREGVPDEGVLRPAIGQNYDGCSDKVYVYQ